MSAVKSALTSCQASHNRTLIKQVENRLSRAGGPGETVRRQARFGWDPHGVQQRGGKVLGRYRLVLDIGPDRVGSPMHDTAADPGPGQYRGETRRPVIAPWKTV